MGCCGGGTASAADRRRNEDINRQLGKDKQMLRNEVKLLLLGAGESGKSTILKQMQVIHGGGYTVEEKMAFKEIIFGNLHLNMKTMLEAFEKLEISFKDPESMQKYVDIIMNYNHGDEDPEVFPAEVADAIRVLWKDETIQEAYARAREYQLYDSAKYYNDNIDRIAAAGYVPDNQDVLRSRVKTTGITETKFKVGELTYRMFDVGGQRSERKKWIHCFENVTAIIFLVAISAYDQVLVEDESVNRMREALTLFDSICNSKWFVKTSIILFLNKMDVFREKIPSSPLEQFFPDYTGGSNVNEAKEFLEKSFTILNQSDAKQVYPHATEATSTDQIQVVMAAVNDIIIQNNLRDCGLL